MVSRSFGTEVRDYDKLSNAITMFATDAARSIRTANLARIPQMDDQFDDLLC